MGNERTLLTDDVLNALAMKNSYVMGEGEIPDDPFFTKNVPEFKPTLNHNVNGIESDGHGGWWVFVDRWPGAIVQPDSSAKLTIRGTEILVAVRNRIASKPLSPVPPDEAPVLYAGDWADATGQDLPSYCNFTAGFFVVKLPFKPSKVILIDK